MTQAHLQPKAQACATQTMLQLLELGRKQIEQGHVKSHEAVEAMFAAEDALEDVRG